MKEEEFESVGGERYVTIKAYLKGEPVSVIVNPSLPKLVERLHGYQADPHCAHDAHVFDQGSNQARRVPLRDLVLPNPGR